VYGMMIMGIQGANSNYKEAYHDSINRIYYFHFDVYSWICRYRQLK